MGDNPARRDHLELLGLLGLLRGLLEEGQSL